MYKIRTLFFRNDVLYLLDQRKIPNKILYVKCKTCHDVAKSIKDMAVRGAPAIGVAAAYGFVLGVKEILAKNCFSLSQSQIVEKVNSIAKILCSSRPTAVNLFWAVERMKKHFVNVLNLTKNKKLVYKGVLKEADKIFIEDKKINIEISKNGAKLIKPNSVVLTHCNAGSLATADVGTAIGVIVEAHRQGKIKNVFVDETRPYLQGARLTMFELMSKGVPCKLITDNMAGFVIKNEGVKYIIVGADRIAKNGDTANKIGTYSLAVLAKYHNIKFFVAAPSSTIDSSISDGKKIVVEYRNEDEIKYINGSLITLKNAKAYYPAFDITPAELIDAIITEKKVYTYPYNF